MTHESNPATHLIKQGEVLRWKNPYDGKFNPYKLMDDPEIGAKYAIDLLDKIGHFDTYAQANPIHAIGDWPDKEEFSREEVEIVWQQRASNADEWKDSEKQPSVALFSRLAARYNGEHTDDTN